MKLWVPSRAMPCPPNINWATPSHTLHPPHRPSLLIRSPYCSRCKQRLTPSCPTCQWSLHILRLHIYPHRTRNLLWLLPTCRNMIRGHYPIYSNNGYSIHRVRPTLRTNKILSRNSNHKLPLRNPLSRDRSSPMSLRRICR